MQPHPRKRCGKDQPLPGVGAHQAVRAGEARQEDGFAVEVLTEEEAALLGRYRRLPPTQRERLQTIASGAYRIAG